MATLSNEDRASLRQAFADDASAVWELIDIGKQDLRAAVNAIDDWIDDNTAAFNSAIPEPARSGLTAKQKAKLLTLVIDKRWEVS
jgi:hypothetical protein